MPLRTKTKKVREKSDPQLLYHCGFTMLMRHQNLNLRPNPSQSIKEILSNCRMKNLPTNARIDVMVESWSLTLSCLGALLVRFFVFIVHNSACSGPINMVSSAKQIYYVLLIHFACSIEQIEPLVAKLQQMQGLRGWWGS